jgi:hypothetical protein
MDLLSASSGKELLTRYATLTRSQNDIERTWTGARFVSTLYWKKKMSEGEREIRGLHR